MEDHTSSVTPAENAPDEQLRGAVVVGLVLGQNPRVVLEAARFAKIFGVQVVVASVDVTRFVGYDDPMGVTQPAAMELAAAASEAEFESIEAECAEALAGHGVRWTARQLVGEPADAIGRLAEELDASLIVVGTRRPGFSETLREFFTGSVAARLAHRQTRSVLVVPQGEPPAEGAMLFPDEQPE